MFFRNTMLAVVASCALAIGSSVPTNAYEGGWAYDDNAGGYEVLKLGDNTDNTYLLLRGTKSYCGSPGVPYARVREVLRRNGTNGQQISWWIANSCDGGYVRVCVRNGRRESACSTYWADDWYNNY